jgi:hypothetical protein
MVEAAAAITQTVIGGRATGASIETAAIIIEGRGEMIGLGVMREEEEDGKSGRVVMTVGHVKTGAGAATESATATRAETMAATGVALAGKGMVGAVAAEAAEMKTTAAQAVVFRPRTRSSAPTCTSCCISQSDPHTLFQVIIRDVDPAIDDNTVSAAACRSASSPLQCPSLTRHQVRRIFCVRFHFRPAPQPRQTVLFRRLLVSSRGNSCSRRPPRLHRRVPHIR